MSVPWAKRLSGRAEVRHFPVTNGPLMLLLPNRAGVPIYGQPRPTVVMMQPPVAPLPPPVPPRPPVPPITVIFWNAAQTCVNTCPEGTTGEPISVTVPANEYSSEVSQEAANAAALAAACAEAAALREENPCVPSEEPMSLWGWGYNADWQLGMGENTPKYTPSIIGTEPEIAWTKVAGARVHSAGLKSDGTLWTWGRNNNGQLGLGIKNIPPSTVNNRFYPAQVGSDTWIDIAVNDPFCYGIKSDGTLWSWGGNFSGQLGQGDTTERLSPTQVGSASNWVQVSCGFRFVLALNSLGEIWACGFNPDGQLGNGSIINSSVLVQVGTDTDWSFVRAGYQHSIALKTDGTIWNWGDTTAGGSLVPVQLETDSDWESATAGFAFTIAKKTDGTLWGIGANGQGELGLGDTVSRTVFTQIGTDTDWSQFVSSNIFAAGGHTIALKTTGAIWGWGTNGQSEQGQGEATFPILSPIRIGPDEHWTGVGAGGWFSFGLRDTEDPPPPPPGTSGVATGGILFIQGAYTIHRFDNNGTFAVIDGAGVAFDILVVGGGGGAGFGGGGAGRIISQTGISLADGSYPVVIGEGGLGQGTGIVGQDGGTTTFNGNSAPGGGGGGGYADELPAADGRDGASGGGGGTSTLPDSPTGTGGTATAGNNGGDASRTNPGGVGGGGGGGSGAVGTNATSGVSTGVGGNGGAGTSSNITGSAVFYAAGGGGAGSTAGGTGGSSVGGIGGFSTNLGSNGLTPGSGGGGSQGLLAGDGMRGVVFIRYLTPP